jgi:hypothetical protein
MKARDNPFSSDRILQIRYQPLTCDWSSLLAHLEHLGYRAAIVGPHGAGKTTLLEDLQEKLEQRGMPVVPLRLDRENPKFERGFLDALFERVTPDDVICLDGAEQLTRLGWLLLKRRARAARGLIVTSHKSGLLPTLIECTTTPALLDAIVARLLSTSTAHAPNASHASRAHVGPPPANELFIKHRGDVRAALREMYDWYAALPC